MPEQNRILCRELSLLAFNRRVLAQAEDKNVPFWNACASCASCRPILTSFSKSAWRGSSVKTSCTPAQAGQRQNAV